MKLKQNIFETVLKPFCVSFSFRCAISLRLRKHSQCCCACSNGVNAFSALGQARRSHRRPDMSSERTHIQPLAHMHTRSHNRCPSFSVLIDDFTHSGRTSAARWRPTRVPASPITGQLRKQIIISSSIIITITIIVSYIIIATQELVLSQQSTLDVECLCRVYYKPLMRRRLWGCEWDCKNRQQRGAMSK